MLTAENPKRTESSAIFGYLIAAGAVLLITLVRFLLDGLLGKNVRLLVFTLAVIIAARFGGLGPGLVATAGSALLSVYFFFEPRYTFAISTVEQATGVVTFLVVGAGISVLAGRLRKMLIQAAAAEEHFRLLVEGVTDAALIALNPVGCIRSWNDGAERITGYKAHEIIGRHFSILHTPEDVAAGIPDSLLQRAAEGEVVKRSGWRVRRDGSMFRVESNIRALREKNGRLRGFSAFTRDMTVDYEQRHALERSEERFRRLIDANVVGLVITEGEVIVEANDYFLNLLGYSRADLQQGTIRWSEITPPSYAEGDRRALQELRETGKCPAYEKEFISKNGMNLPVLIGSVTLGSRSDEQYLSFVVDQTQRARLEEQFRQAQKLESLGQLAGGIAHDFNNLLTIIKGYAEMTLDEIDPRHPLFERIEDIFEASTRAATLTRQLLTFSRRQVSEPKSIFLNELVRDVQRMLRRLIGEDIELTVSLADETLVIRADPGHIEQVILNLAVNARDAMPKGGNLSIETSLFVVDEHFSDNHIALPPGAYVMLSVSDTGVGMSAEVKSHIFEPFFTTKERGKGTGLGLATVYGIVSGSGGWISVYSEPGNGTVFKMLFPAVQPDGERLEPEPVPITVRGNETILLAEDEGGVRKYTRHILEYYGYTVVESASGTEAFELAKSHKGPIHLLLTDMVMPGMGGTELSEKFSKIRPGVPVLHMSGYTDRIRRTQLPSTVYIQKPFAAADLLNRIRYLLDAPSTGDIADPAGQAKGRDPGRGSLG